MSVLEFWDVFRMFLGELENRDYNPDQVRASVNIMAFFLFASPSPLLSQSELSCTVVASASFQA